MELLIWIGIFICLSQSGSLAGLNLACFSVSKLKLELEVEKQNEAARRLLELRKDSNFLLVSILWANVAFNVLLALLSGSVLSGIMAFLFSTVVITLAGEILPQAYFSRSAIKIAAKLSPLIKAYQLLFYPIARPTALILDRWLGKEAITYYKESDLRELVKMHMNSTRTEIEPMEGRGALNFLALDDLPIAAEGEPVDFDSIIQVKFENLRPVFPEISSDTSDAFLQQVQSSGKKWVILVDENEEPGMVMNSDKFIREALFDHDNLNPYRHCHKPIIIRIEETNLGQVIPRLKVEPEHCSDDVIDDDIILLWSEHKKIITGSDVLGRLLRGITKNIKIAPQPNMARQLKNK